MNSGAAGEPPIRSIRHPMAVRIRRILLRPQVARRQGVFLLDGVHLLEEALQSRHIPELILRAPRLARSPRGAALGERIAERDWPQRMLSDELMERLAPTSTPQGVLGLFPRPDIAPGESLPHQASASAPLLVLAGIQDPLNLGALARTARAFGCRHLVTTAASADPFHVRALRASAGALLHLTIAAGVTAPELATWSESEAVHLVALLPHGGKPIEQLAAAWAADPLPVALVLGAEGPGIPSDLARICTARASIPMPGEIDSLGVTAAGTLALYLTARALHERA